MTKKLNKRDLIETARELAEQLHFDETGAYIETYVAGRYFFAPLPSEVQATLTHLLYLVERLESEQD